MMTISKTCLFPGSNQMLQICSVVTLSLVLGVAGNAFADSYEADFDTFATGEVNGQDGWTSGHGSSSSPLYDVEVVSNTSGHASLGTKSLRVSNAITSGSFDDQTFSKSMADEAGEASAATSALSGGTRQPYFEAQWDFASTVPGNEQPGLAVVASPDRGDTMRMSWLQMLDTPSGLQLNFEEYQHSILDFTMTAVATNLDRTVTHTVKITMHFIDGPTNDVMNIYLNGVLIHTGTTWEDYYRDWTSSEPYPVDSIMFRVAGTAFPDNSGKGFLIDNFSSYSGPVPLAPVSSSNATLFWQLPSGQVACWIMNSNGTVTSVVNVYTAATPWQVKAVADIDGDGVADLIWQLPSGPVACWTMNSNGSMKSVVNVYTGATPWQVKATGDIDGDGVADLIWQLPSGQVACWTMNSNGTMKSIVYIHRGTTEWQVKATGDIDGDGVADLIWQLPSGQAACWLMNSGGTMKSIVYIYHGTTEWQIKAVGDIDSDGVADLIWQLPSGRVVCWIMNSGGTMKSIADIYTGSTAWQVRAFSW